MSRRESDREDLIREAVAMPERGEFRVPGFDDLVTIGFRASAAMSVFIGPDCVYQFDPHGRLRRAFLDGCLFRSEHITLARLQRIRTEASTQLLRSDLSHDELSAFRTLMLGRLSSISDAIRCGTILALRSIPNDVDLRPRIGPAITEVLTVEPWLSREIRAAR